MRRRVVALFRSASTNESETRSTEFLLVTSSTTQIQAIAYSEVPDDTPTNEQIVLSTLVRGNI